MATTPPEFFRLLPRVLDGIDHAVRDHEVEIGTPEKGIVISVKAAEPRVIAGLVLERCTVELAFTGCPAREVDDFLAKFDRVYRRGGG